MIPYQRLSQIIPQDQALANKALATALGQLKNITALSLPELSRAAASAETQDGLPLITALTQAVPDSVRTTIASTVATGSGPGGTLVLGDILGTASGYNITVPLTTAMNLTATLNTANLKSIYQVMANTANLQYGSSNVTIPVGLPGANTYANLDVAMANLCALANANVSALATQAPATVSALNTAWITVANVVASQTQALSAGSPSGINYANIQANLKSVVPGFVSSLHDWGTQVQPGGANEYLTSVANLATQTGQAIAGTLREGRTLAGLASQGLGVDSTIPAE